MLTLTTHRLTLRPLSVDDIDSLHELLSLRETDEYNTLGIPASMSDTEVILRKWLGQQTLQVFTILIKSGHSFAGLIAINLADAKFMRGEVWYKLHKAYWGKGFATEALQAIVKYGFGTLQLHRIEAGAATENAASHRVLEKAGFVREGMKRKNLPIRGEWKDAYFYSILEEEFLNQR